jgi:DNA-binding CsgD family transcriptional regulator
MVELRAPDEAPPSRMRGAIIVTTNAFVYRDVRNTLRRMGIPRILHGTPSTVWESPADIFWVMDGRFPGAMELIRTLLTSGRRNGMVLSSPNDHQFNTRCARIGVPALLMHRAVEEAEPKRDPSIRLTERELDVIRLVAEGKSNKEIGEELHLSPLTIKSHLTRIMRRLGTGDRANIVYRCLRAGLIQ